MRKSRGISKTIGIAILLVIVVIAVVSVLLITTPPSAPTQPTGAPMEAKKRKLYISHWGFGWDLIYKQVIRPFEEKFNVEVVLISGTTAERYAKLVNKTEPVPDVIFLPDYYTYMATKQGLLLKMDLGKLSNYGEILPFIRNQLPDYIREYGVPHTIQDMAIAYRSDRVPSISSWRDIWTIGGGTRILWPYITATSGPMALVLTSLSFTGTLSDVNTSIMRIAELKQNIAAFYTRSGDPQLFFERGEADVAPILRYNWGPLKKLNLSIKIVCPSEGSVYVLNMMSIANGSKNVDLAYEFINYWISEEVQRKLAESLVDAPINSKVALPPGHPFDISCVYNKPIYLEPKLLAENLKGWTELWRKKFG